MLIVCVKLKFVHECELRVQVISLVCFAVQVYAIVELVVESVSESQEMDAAMVEA